MVSVVFFNFESFGIRAWTRSPLRTFELNKTLNSQSVIEIIVFSIVTIASHTAQGLCCWDKASFVTHRPWVFRMAQVDSLDVDCLRVMYMALAKATKLFEPSDYACAEMLATILRDCLREKAGEHIDSAGEVAILSTYQSDSASFLTRSVVRGRISGQAQKRVGMCSSEVLLERGFLLKRKVSGEARCSFFGPRAAHLVCGENPLEYVLGRVRVLQVGALAGAQEHLHPTLRV